MRRWPGIVGVVVAGCAVACRASGLADRVGHPSAGEIAVYLLLGALVFLAEELLGELAWNLLPAWAKTRRALWTAIAVATLLTAVAVTYWNLASPR